MTLTQQRLKELLVYDPETGVFTWRKDRADNARRGAIAGSPKSDGYMRLCIDGRRYRAHRIAWLYVTGKWPTKEIDHINGDGLDNRWANLREATRSQNMCNTALRADNKSGFKGVSWVTARRKWHAQIAGKSLGHFDNLEAAARAYRKAATERFGEFANFGETA